MANPKCWHYQEIDSKAKANCPNCGHWDISKARCKDEALLLMNEQMKLQKYERLMSENRGVNGPL